MRKINAADSLPDVFDAFTGTTYIYLVQKPNIYYEMNRPVNLLDVATALFVAQQ